MEKPYPLNRISIKGFKSIKELDLTLSPLNVLIGANGSGKSNFISAFSFLHQLAEGRLQEYVATRGGAETILHHGRKVTESLSFRVEVTGYEYSIQLLPTVNDRFVINIEKIYIENNSDASPAETTVDKSIELYAENGVNESQLSLHELSQPEFMFGEMFRQWRVFHFNDTSENAKLRAASNVNDNSNLRPDGSNLAAILYLLQEKYHEHYRNIIDTIRLAAPFFDDFTLKPDALNERMIRLSWRQRRSDAYFDAHALSDGTLRFICLATLLMQPEPPPLILLDEPELGLHPYAITLLAGMLRSVATRSQVIVSTQSVTLLNEFTPEEVIVVDQERGASQFRWLSSDELSEWISEYSLGELWQKNIFGGRP